MSMIMIMIIIICCGLLEKLTNDEQMKEWMH